MAPAAVLACWSAGAFVFAAGFLVFAWDCVRPKGKEPDAPRNSWNAGTLEWATPVPTPAYGMRSIPEINSRYPLWEQQGLKADELAGRGYLPDAPTLEREALRRRRWRLGE